MWSDYFKSQLNAAEIYPRFRIRIGTRSIPGWASMARGTWDNDNILELTSHGDNTTSADYFGAPDFKSMQCLTSDISFGAQSISPPQWTYQQASVSVKVLPEAYGELEKVKPGTYMVMECSLNDSDYETIFVGMFWNCSWDMTGTVTVQFRDLFALFAGRSNDDATTHNIEETPYMWWKGIGTYSWLTSGGSVTPGSDTEVQIALGRHKKGTKGNADPTLGGNGSLGDGPFEKSGKSLDAWEIRTVDSLGLITSSAEDNERRMCRVNVDGGDSFYMHYADTSTTSSVAKLTGIQAQVDGGLFGSNASAAIPINSTLEPVVAIYGNPVCVLFNTLYGYGWPKDMVGALFGNVEAAKTSPFVDFEFMKTMANNFRHNHEYACSFSSPGEAASKVGVFRMVITGEEVNGSQRILAGLAKWGVVPCFREGAYAAILVGAAEDLAELPEMFWGTLTRADIMSVNYTMIDEGCRTSYCGYTSSCSDLRGSFEPSISNDSTRYNPQSAPVVGEITVKSDAAASGGSAQGFYLYFDRNFFRPYYNNTPQRLSVVCRGLRAATACIGQYIDISIDGDFGPERSWSSGFVSGSVIDTVNIPGTHTEDSSQDIVWMIVGINADWVGNRVTLELIKVVDKPYIANTDAG
jgi:hypothetical protein